MSQLTALTDEQRYKDGNIRFPGTGYYLGRRFIPHILAPRYDLLIPSDRIAYRNDLLDRIESAHKKGDRIQLVADLRWLLDKERYKDGDALRLLLGREEFPPAPPEETEVVG